MSKRQISQIPRIDVVFIRKSSDVQADSGQRANVETMLKAEGISIPEQHWFTCTVPRSKVQGNTEFKRLMRLVEENRVGTVYIESQDRFGTGDITELFTLLGILSAHGTRLYDLREKIDLTGRDDTTQIKTFLGGLKSKKERQDLAYRSLRTRLNHFKKTKSWPTGQHPYGFGKRCLAKDGKTVLWEWIPVTVDRSSRDDPRHASNSRAGMRRLVTGDLFKVVNGVRTLTDRSVRIPPKTKGEEQVTQLVPGLRQHVDAVRLVFDLYTRIGLSRRQISRQLNRDGYKFYDRPFSNTHVNQILTNPAYTGDTHFGKIQSGELQTFNSKGETVPVNGSTAAGHRAIADRLIHKDTHKGLIDRATWERAQKRLKSEKPRHSLTSVNPAYYLRPIFICGHCGKPMTGRTEKNPNTGKKTPIYVCSTYIRGHRDGYSVPCGYHRINHDDAERMLLAKLRDSGRELNLSKSESTHLAERLDKLEFESDDARDKWRELVREGMDAVIEFLKDEYKLNGDALEELEQQASGFYTGRRAYLEPEPGNLPPVVASFKEFKKALLDAERQMADRAKAELHDLMARHDRYVEKWVDATELTKAAIDRKIAELEEAIRKCKAQMEPLSKRLESLYREEDERDAERRKILKEWPAMKGREKGESLRQIFNRVTLFWDRVHHPPSERPTRPRKTKRAGRYSYELKNDAIKWELATSNLVDPW